MSNPKLLKGRSSECGAYYMVTSVVRNRRPLFVQQRLAAIAAAEMKRIADDGGVLSLAWVVMPDHVHWLFQLRRDGLSACMQAFKSRSARAINADTGSCGNVWQTGFHDHRLRGEEDLRAQACYVVANPLRKGLVERIEDYPFWWCRWIKASTDL